MELYSGHLLTKCQSNQSNGYNVIAAQNVRTTYGDLADFSPL